MQTYKKMLRQIQGLPSNITTEFIYLALGTIPLEGKMHQKILNLYGSLCRLPRSHSLYLLTRRQMAMRTENKHSWFTLVEKLGTLYDLNVYHNLHSPNTKELWKKWVKDSIHKHWHIKLMKVASSKTTLKWFVIPNEPRKHGLWRCCNGNSTLVEAGGTRARMLAGRFKTQLETSRFYKKEDSICKLCKQESEDIGHILVRCPILQDRRANKVRILQAIYEENQLPSPVEEAEICSAILNGDCYIRSSVSPNPGAPNNRLIRLPEHASLNANKQCNLLCWNLHIDRDYRLQNF